MKIFNYFKQLILYELSLILFFPNFLNNINSSLIFNYNFQDIKYILFNFIINLL